MKKKTRMMLEEAQNYCDENDKSTGFMIQYMQDFAGVDHDTVMDFLIDQSEEEKKEYSKKALSSKNEYCIEFTAVEETVYTVTIEAESPEEAFKIFNDSEYDRGDYNEETFLGTAGERDVRIVGDSLTIIEDGYSFSHSVY